ncbi:MAG: polyprenyl synthetase family protein, partial [Muribaculaceae bacterium]|nr:polyprenyl synthetase family protein [Muribaculaceae bacterium]
MKTIVEYSQIIEEAIKSLNLPIERLGGLYSPIVYGMSEGGKRLRPVLTLMACEAFGKSYEEAVKAGVALEMYHNFTLLHDDVMDNSDMRRGRPTVHRKWDANTAILSGDTMLTLATQFVMNVDNSILR